MNFIDKRGGFFIIDNEVIDNGELDVYAFKTYAVIVRHANQKTKSAFPSLNTLAKKVGCGKKKIIECIKILVERGYISKTLRKDDRGDHLSNLYHLLPTPSASQRQEMVSEREQGSILEKLKVVTEGNTNKTNCNKLELKGNIQDEDTEYSDSFERVWKLYPKKIDKKLGYKSFKMATKKHSIETIRLGTQRYAEYIKGNSVETRYIKHATTFFNNECYLEYIELKQQHEFTKVIRTSNFSIDSLLD
ncbi:helix-turn-helix domain-containing protein [Bacillus clarus]|uniref:Helix-turn-helix domain protein n=1 Tax=Bacillus clarus TaxID=2338372 RepID=A0A090YBL4_9BACI|nr:helix-turn-helix domain-containing protein [Bacillus clarus]KFM95237.1 helix-turn-helix domain protein [Bacillus clarus]RFT61746.1 helix-turn-helix domain-containing protein [Bacillus clarus]